MFDAVVLRADFPILARQVHGKKLVYLDNAATSQKPRVVIDAITHYYETSNANVHRGVHSLSDESTKLWEESRATIAQFFGAQPSELIMTRNTTEALNGVAYGWADHHLKPGDVLITSLLEHHANIVTWQEVARRTGAVVEYLSLDNTGRVDLSSLTRLLAQHGAKIKLVALAAVSNAVGTLVPIEQIVDELAAHFPDRSMRPKVVVDGAQAAPHLPITFDSWDIDFFAFSGHKMLGPMGSGGLLVRHQLLHSGQMRPWLFGGGMIAEVHTTGTQFNEDITERFTPGTPDVASAVGLAAACKYLHQLNMQAVLEHDQKLVQYTIAQLSQIPQVQIVGPVTPQEAEEGGQLDRVGSVSFIYQGVHAHDVAQILDSEGVAVRSGHHCTMPLHESCGWQATVRVSFQVYNTVADVDAFITALAKVKHVFKI